MVPGVLHGAGRGAQAVSFDSFFSADAANMRPSAIRAFAKLINDPNIITFAGGSPNPDTFPAERIGSIAERVVRERRAVALQYGPTRGLPRLCEFIAGLCRERGIKASADGVIVTTGSQQALDLVAHTFLDPGDVVLVELPTYIGGSSSFYARSARMEGVAQDDDGIVPESLEEVARRTKAKLLYTIPNFQNPSGRLMSPSRRRAVLEIAVKYNFLIIEDDPYGELVYVDGADTTPMKAADRDGRIIYLGSFSKVLAPGLRCGWILAAPQIVEKVEIAKQAADLCSGMLDQSIVDEFCSSGELPAQIKKVRAFYRGKRGTMIQALQKHFTGRASWTSAIGGLFTFVTLNDDVDTGSRVADAVARGVAYVPGRPFFVDDSGRNTMRLTFAKESDARIADGIARLSEVLAQR
jgi:2-aminoadipate transaminase